MAQMQAVLLVGKKQGGFSDTPGKIFMLSGKEAQVNCSTIRQASWTDQATKEDNTGCVNHMIVWKSGHTTNPKHKSSAIAGHGATQTPGREREREGERWRGREREREREGRRT